MATAEAAKELEGKSADAIIQTRSNNNTKKDAMNAPFINFKGSNQSTRSLPLHRSLEFVRLNVGGRSFITRKHHFASFPRSRLGQLMRLSDKEKILELCDGYRSGTERNSDSAGSGPTGPPPSSKHPAGHAGEFPSEDDMPIYFFDRSGRSFDEILDLYRHGTLHVSDPASGCSLMAKRELEFWGLDEFLLESCCALSFHQRLETCDKEIKMAEKEERRAQMQALNEEEHSEDSKCARSRKWLWNLLEYPNSSILGKVCAVISLVVILVSTFTFLLEMSLESSIKDKATYNQVHQYLDYIEAFSLIFFTIEYLLRLISAPKLCRFLFGLMNLADLMAVLPFLISIVMYELQSLNYVGKAGKLLHLIRVLKIFRIFKIVRHLASLQTLLTTLRQAKKELGLLSVLTTIVLLMYSSLLYYAEKGLSNWTYFDSVIFVIHTLTTVGHGQRVHPETLVGQFLAAITSLSGVFVLTLPIPIVLTSFSGYYKNRMVRCLVAEKGKRRLVKSRGLGLDVAKRKVTPSAPRHSMSLSPKDEVLV